MPAALITEIDLIEELAYRCWARENYAPSERRDAAWHPIILEEMARRDQELSEQLRYDERHSSPASRLFVPLVPTITHYVHPGQLGVREPYFLSSEPQAEAIYSGMVHGWDIYEYGRS